MQTNVVMQAIINHVTLDGFALQAHSTYVAQSVSRLLHGYFEILLRAGRCPLPAIATLTIAKASVDCSFPVSVPSARSSAAGHGRCLELADVPSTVFRPDARAAP